MTKFKVNKKVMLEGLGLGSSGIKTYASQPQQIVVSEAQLSRLLEMTRTMEEEGFEQIVPNASVGESLDLPEGDDSIFDDYTDMGDIEDSDITLEGEIKGLIHKTRLQELEMIIDDAHSIIREAIVTERISGLKRHDYMLMEQGQYDRNPGIAAAEGIENVINGIRKAYDYVKDPTTKKKIWNTLTKLNNFMTVTAELIGSGASQRAPRATSTITKPLPYPEIEVPEELEDIDDELHEQTKVDAIERIAGETVDMFADWWNKGVDTLKPIATKWAAEYYAEADEITKKKALQVAKKLRNTMQGGGTDEQEFWKITKKYARGGDQGIKNRALIREAFNDAYNKDLKSWIKSDFNCLSLIGVAKKSMRLVKNLALGKNKKADCEKVTSKALRAWGY